jgi:glycosyltransferase involved in cell wall biosynthesis
MVGFIRKKWQIIQFESENSGVSPFSLFLKKTISSSTLFGWNIFNLFVFLVISPVLFILLVISRFQKKKNNAFFIGLEHVIQKTIERSSLLELNYLTTHFFSFEQTGKRAQTDYPLTITKYSSSILWDQIVFCWRLLSERPMYIEIYFEGNGIRQLISVAMARIAGSLCISIERGAFSNALENTLSASYAFMLINTMRMSHKIFYREPYMLDFLKRCRLSDKAFFDYNKVPISDDTTVNLNKPPHEILFLNGFAKMRRIDLVIDAFKLVQHRLSNMDSLHLTLVGYRNDLEKQYAEKLIQLCGLSHKITLAGWTENSKDYFRKASIFLLPADLVFCNFSLLEAMEAGCIPIVSKVRDSDRIVSDGVDGFIVNQEAEAIAQKLEYLLTSHEVRIKMAHAAREKIKSSFDNKHRMQPILSTLTKMFDHYKYNN